MSEHLRAAREKLHGAIADIDARLAELNAFKAEEAQLRDHRAQLITLLGDPSSSSEVGHVTPQTPAPPPRQGRSTPSRGGVQAPAPRPPTSIRHVDAANRILVVAARKGHATAADVYGAAGMPKMSTRRLLNELIAARRLVRTGKTQAVRYSVPGRANGAPAEPEGDRGARHAARGR